MINFNELGLSQAILDAVSKMGFEEATPIQEATIPQALAGEDLIGQAQTGSGKTAAFGIPILEKLDPEDKKIQAIVVAPTRELAIQVAQEINRLGHFKQLKALPIYGGQDIGQQLRSLRTFPQIIVGTPGRLMDHMRRGTIKLDAIKIAVLDEADEMLNMGFIEDIEEILSHVSADRQTLLFSATMPKPIQNLASKFMTNPRLVQVQTKEMTVPEVEQHYVEVHERQKFDTLCRLLDMESPNLAMIFGRTKRRVDELSEALITRGYSAEGIHGDLTQSKRDMVMKHFREGSTNILVATDVAARGLDISGVTHVYNFDMPQDPEGYVHRIGRTGRAGKTGSAITFVSPREIAHLELIERVVKKKITRRHAPTLGDAVEGQQKIAIEKLLDAVENADLRLYREYAQELLDETDSATLVAAAIKLITKEPDASPVRLTEEAPVRVKRPNPAPYNKPGNFRPRKPYQGRSNNQRPDSRSEHRTEHANRKPYDPDKKPASVTKSFEEGRSQGHFFKGAAKDGDKKSKDKLK